MNRRAPIIRETTCEDIPALAGVHVRLWRETYEAIAATRCPTRDVCDPRGAVAQGVGRSDSGVFVLLERRPILQSS